MVPETEKTILRSKLEKYEGRVTHMYLDSKGFVTVGVGHLLKDVASAQKITFKKSDNKSASKDEIKVDFDAVKAKPKNKIASYYKKYTKLKISDADIDTLTNKHIDSFEAELKIIFPELSSYSSEVRLALFDMIFNLGMTNLNGKWPSFKKAVKAKDWTKAAKESKRKAPVSKERNDYVKGLFEKEAASKAAKEAAKLGTAAVSAVNAVKK